jgi:hypothetical protein
MEINESLLSLITSRSAPLDERVEQIILNSLSNDSVSDRPLQLNQIFNMILMNNTILF